MSWPTRTYRFTVPFVKGKQRPRLGRGGNVYTPRETRKAEAQVAEAYRNLVGNATPAPAYVPVRLEITVRRRLPKRVPRRVLARRDLGKPDLDNVTKLVKDALNGVAWEDDCQVVDERAWREWRTRRETDVMEIAVTVPRFWDSSWNEMRSRDE